METFDVVIIGGSYAGLSAAMTLGRARRNVLVLDAGAPCNRHAPHAHNLLGRDGEPPAVIAAKARQDVLAYPTVALRPGKVVKASGSNGSFQVQTEEGSAYLAKKLLLATGVKDIPLTIEGFKECWGISVLHCPYCHGYEVRDEAIGVVGNGDMGFEYLRLVHQWSRRVILFTNGPSTLDTQQTARILSRGVQIVEKELRAISHEGGYIRELICQDGSSYPLKALFARGATELTGDIAHQLGCEVHTEGMFKGLIAADEMGKTNVAGVYAAGDNITPLRTLSNAIAGGTRAGAAINHELVAEEF